MLRADAILHFAQDLKRRIDRSSSMSRIMWAYLFSLKKLKLATYVLYCSETRALRRLQNAGIKKDKLHFLAKLPTNDSSVPDDYPLNVDAFISLCEPPFSCGR